MSVYHWLVVLVLLLAYLMHGEKKGNFKYILLVIVLLFCVYGLRDAYSIGHDSSSSYLHGFEAMEGKTWEDMPKLSEWLSSEDFGEERAGHERSVAFQWLMKLSYDWFEGDYQWFLIIIAAFVMIAVAQFVQRFSPSPVQSFLYYFGLTYYTMMFSVLKQSIAMAFILFAFNAILDRKLIRFLLMVWFASLFHFPALVFLPAYWIANMRLGRTYLIFLAALFVVTYLFRDQLVDWMTDAYDTQVYENSGMRFLANKVIVMLVIIVAALIIRPPHENDKVYSSLLMIIGVATVIQTFSSYNNTFERLADYYFQFAIVFIPMVFEDVKTPRRHLSEKELKLVRTVGPYLFCAFAIWRFLNTVMNDEAYYPYQFYFQAEKAEETLAVWLNLL